MPFEQGIQSFVFFDLETAGLEPHHPNIEIAAIAVARHDLAELETFDRKILFDEGLADAAALEMNSYDPGQWEIEGVPQARALADFNDFCSKYACEQRLSARGRFYFLAKLAGHNAARFDLPRLSAWADEFGQFPNWDRFFALDTLHAAQWHVAGGARQPANWKLGTLAREFLPQRVWEPLLETQHTALSDVRVSIELAKLFLGRA